MLSQYGVASSVTGSADGVNYNIAEAPLYFVRSGTVAIDKGRLKNASFSAYNWSSWTYPSDANYAYYLGFDTSDVSSSSYYYRRRYDAFPLRCLAS